MFGWPPWFALTGKVTDLDSFIKYLPITSSHSQSDFQQLNVVKACQQVVALSPSVTAKANNNRSKLILFWALIFFFKETKMKTQNYLFGAG